MNPETMTRKIGKGTGYIVAGSVMGYIISFFYKIVLARWLGPESYGVFSLVLMIIGLSGAFFTLGIPSAITKFTSEYKAKGKDTGMIFSNSMKIMLPLSLFCSLAIFVSAEFIAKGVFNMPQATVPFQLTSIVMFFTLLFSTLKSNIVGHQRMEFSSLGIITEKLTRLVLSAVLLYLGFELMGVMGALIIGSILTAAVIFISYRSIAPVKITPLDGRITKALLRFGIPVFITTIGWTVLSWTDTFFIGVFLPAEMVGYYNAALPVTWVMGVLITSLSGALFPAFSEISAGGNESMLRSTFNRSMKYALYFIIPASAGAFMLSEPIIRILFTAEYLPAVAAFQILVFGSIFLSLRHMTDSYIKGIGKPEIIMKISVLIALTNIVLNWFLIQSHGIAGAAIATSASFALSFFLSLFLIRKRIDLKVGYLPKSIAAVLVMALAVWILRTSAMASLLKTIAIVIIGAGIYFGVLYLLRGFDKRDKKIVKGAWMRVRRRIG